MITIKTLGLISANDPSDPSSLNSFTDDKGAELHQ